MQMELHITERQAIRIGIVFGVFGRALVLQIARPRLKRQSARHHRSDLKKRRDARRPRTTVLGASG